MTLGVLGAVAPIVLLVLAPPAPISAGQTTSPPGPPLVIDSMAGQDLYAAYCASCHGSDGRGHGPTATALKTAVPDLTGLARRASGRFPAARVRSIVILGEPLDSTSHGSSEMPVWGPIFAGLDPDPTRTRVRIDAIVDHLASIQVR